eukprot:scaffold62214_cov71-Phaeocystis_antarctica.AAC.4
MLLLPEDIVSMTRSAESHGVSIKPHVADARFAQARTVERRHGRGGRTAVLVAVVALAHELGRDITIKVPSNGHEHAPHRADVTRAIEE